MENLQPLQKKVLELFSKSTLKDKFYWTGGTLLSAYYLNHRISKDIDFFTNENFDYNEVIKFVTSLKKEVELSSIEEKKIYDRYEFTLRNSEKILIDFVRYDYPLLNNKGVWMGIRIDSLDDIAANKLVCLFDRNDPKDLFDLYFLMTAKKYTVEELIKLTKKKFGISFGKSSILSEFHKSAKQLENLKPLMLTKNKKTLIKDIENYFADLSNSFLNKNLG
ncbi:MAG: nucleotidyl transferase AbiEii/AbiGii toxin family protein [bacterium]|nr:nucleotidyl transferase AbiEii/AbiGii toxin family protein [bacterium]